MISPRAIYEELVKRGMHPKDAAKEAQARTGMSVVTGKPIDKKLRFTKTKVYNGQYGVKY